MATLELVFYRDKSRRVLPAVTFISGAETFVITTGPATIVPDGTPHAIDWAFLLQVNETRPIAAEYDPRSTAELFVYRADGKFSSFRLKDSVTVAVGDSLSAISKLAPDGWVVNPSAATVTSLDAKVDFKLQDRKVHHKFSKLIAIDKSMPEGTPLFKGGRLAGITLLGTRFLGKDAGRSYVVPAERIAALVPP